MPMPYPKPKFGRAVSHAKTLAPPESAQGLPVTVAALPLPISIWSSSENLGGWCWKTYPGYLLATKAAISEGSFTKWRGSGMAWRGEFWTRDFSESPKGGVGCLLLQVLEPTAPARYFLSAKAAKGILERANRRGKLLPPLLQEALQALATGMETSQQVRRLTPMETERLMGWPDGWTVSKKWLGR
jgi:hypothetical protein